MATKELSDWLHEEPAVVSSFSDALVSEWFTRWEVPNANEALAAEVWLRRWLYKEDCPTAILEAINYGRYNGLAGYSDDFYNAFHDGALKLHCQSDGEVRPAVNFNNTTEIKVWNLLLKRIRSYLEADGLIALVPKGHHAAEDGVAVPFQLEPGSGMMDAKDESLLSWENDLENFRQSYDFEMKVRVSAVFPKDKQPSGTSFGFALAVARERLGGRLAWFKPLDVLVTGSVANRSIESVEGVIAKQALANRIGCAFFVAPEIESCDGNVGIAAGTPLKTALRSVEENLPTPSNQAAVAKDIVYRCHKELQLWRSFNPKPIVRYQEMAHLLQRALSNFEDDSVIDPDAVLALNLLDNISASVYGSAFRNDLEDLETLVFKPYRKRAIYGRTGLVSELNHFIQERPGGLKLVIGKGGYGKTALLAHWLAGLQSRRACFSHFFRANIDNLRSAHRFFKRLAQFLQNLLPEEFQDGAPPSEVDAQEVVRRLLRTYSYIPPDKRPHLLIVIDGIDEASQPYFECFFRYTRDSWPDHLHVIVSARTSGGTDLDEIKTWATASQETPLDRMSLDKPAILSWLKSCPSPLKEMSDVNDFVEGLLNKNKADGEVCALYVESLLAGLSQKLDLKSNWRKELEEMPNDYVNLIKQQIENAFVTAAGTSRENLNIFRELLELLAVARGPLDETDLRELLGTSLLPEFEELHRWVTDWQGPGERGRLFGFNHKLIGEALEKAGWPLSNIRAKLLEYCLKWKDSFSPYALRHLIEHLREAKATTSVSNPHKTLYDLAVDDSFLKAQFDVFKQDVHAPLRTLRAALQLASDTDNVAQMAKLGFKHAVRVSQMASESPLKSIRTGNKELANGVISFFEKCEDRMLWNFLIALEHICNRDFDQAAYSIENSLLNERMGKFPDEYSGCALALAFVVLKTLDIFSVSGLVAMFRPHDQIRLCGLLAEAKEFGKAELVQRTINSRKYSDLAERRIVVELAKERGCNVLPRVDRIHDKDLRDLAKSEIAVIVARAGNIEGARRILSTIPPHNVLQRIEVLCSIARASDTREMKLSLKEAWNLLEAQLEIDLKAIATAKLAVAELDLGYREYSEANIKYSIELCKSLTPISIRVVAIRDVVLCILVSQLARTHFADSINLLLELALDSIFTNNEQCVSPEQPSDELLLSLVKLFTKVGDYETSGRFAHKIRSKVQKHSAFAIVVGKIDAEQQPSPQNWDKYFDRLLSHKVLHEGVPKRGRARPHRMDLLHILSEAVLNRVVAQNYIGIAAAIGNELSYKAPHKRSSKWGPARVLGAIGFVASSHKNDSLARYAFGEAENQIEKLVYKKWDYCWALINLAEDQGKSGNYDEARRILNKSKKFALELRANNLVNATRLFCEVAAIENRIPECVEASDTFQNALNFVCGSGWKNQATQIEALGELIEQLSKSNLKTKAIESLDLAEALLRGMKPKEDCIWEAHAKLALSLIKAGRFYPDFRKAAANHSDAALKQFNLYGNTYRGNEIHPPHGLVNRVRGTLDAYEDKIDEAMRKILQIKTVNDRSTAARDIAIACIDRGNTDGIVTAMAFVTNRRSELLPDIAQEFLAKNDKNGIKNVFQESVFFLDCNYRMLALLLKSYRSNVAILNEILGEIGLRAVTSANKIMQPQLRIEKTAQMTW